MGVGQLIRLLCWLLIVCAVAAALFIVGFQLNLFGTPPHPAPTTDFVERLLAFRNFDQQTFAFSVAASLFVLGVWLAVALLGPALRSMTPSPAADVMAAAFVIAGTIGVISQLIGVALNQVAADIAYCDCGYKVYEVIGQAKTLDAGFTVQSWLDAGSIAVAAFAVAMAGRLLSVSPTWRLLSYAIAIAFAFAVVLRILFFGDFADLLLGVAVGIGIPIWAFLLARGTGNTPDPATA